jgi:hypothetical protein
MWKRSSSLLRYIELMDEDGDESLFYARLTPSPSNSRGHGSLLLSVILLSMVFVVLHLKVPRGTEVLQKQ